MSEADGCGEAEYAVKQGAIREVSVRTPELPWTDRARAGSKVFAKLSKRWRTKYPLATGPSRGRRRGQTALSTRRSSAPPGGYKLAEDQMRNNFDRIGSMPVTCQLGLAKQWSVSDDT